MAKRFALWIAASLCILLSTFQAPAQTLVVASCPGATPFAAAGQSGLPYVIDVNGNLCIAGLSASVSGFAPTSTGTPFTATTGGVTGTLPSGTVVVAFNTSTTIPAYCKLGASATVGDVLVAPSSWFAFTVGASTQLTCITASSTAVINMVGGSGIPSGSGGGGGGGGALATAAAPSYSEGVASPLSTDLAGSLRVNVTNANANGQATMANSSPVTIASNQAAIPVNLASTTTGGCTPGKLLSAATTNATNVKNSAGTLCKVVAVNTTATIYYLKFYNTSSSPTCNSDTVVATYPVPPNNGGIAVSLSAYGEAYGTGISFCLTGALADNDNTSAATGVVISYSYK